MTKIREIYRSCQRISSISALVLKLGMFFVCLQAAALAIEVHDVLQYNPLLVPLYYPPLLEYILLPFTLVVAGALLFDALEKEKAGR